MTSALFSRSCNNELGHFVKDLFLFSHPFLFKLVIVLANKIKHHFCFFLRPEPMVLMLMYFPTPIFLLDVFLISHIAAEIGVAFIS